MNNKKIVILVVGLLIVLMGLTGCSNESELMQEAKSAQKEETTMLDLENIASLTGTTSKQTSSSVSAQSLGDVLISEVFNINSQIQITNPLSVEHLDSYDWEFEILDWDSSCEYKVYNEDGYVRTEYDKVLSLHPQDAGNTSSVYVKAYGPNNDWQLEIRAKDNLSNTFGPGQCTDGVAIIKNPQTANQDFGQAKLPWEGDAKEWYANAEAEGFRVGSEPKVGAIMVIDHYEGMPAEGHVAIVTSLNPLKITAMNDTDGSRVFTKDRILYDNDNYVSGYIRDDHCLGYIYYKLDNTTPPSEYVVN